LRQEQRRRRSGLTALRSTAIEERLADARLEAKAEEKKEREAKE
jgi:hypothetical protein